MRAQGTDEPSGSHTAAYVAPQYQPDLVPGNDVESSIPILLHSHEDGPGSEERGKEVVWAMPEPQPSWISPTTAGLLLFAFSTLCVTLMGTTAKLLAQRGLPVFEIVFVRSVFMTSACIPLLFWQRVDPRGNRTMLLWLRGTLGFGSVSSIYWAVALLPLGDATLLSFLAPLFVAVSAPMLLGEVPSRHAMFAVPVCFIGVLLVAKPGPDLQGTSLPILGVAVGIAQAVFSAGAKMSVRELRKSEVSLVIVFWMAAVSSVMAALGCVLLPQGLRLPADRTEWLLLFGTALAGMGNQVSMTLALRRVQAVSAIALSYLSIVWSLTLGALVFREHPDAMSLSGAALICSCTLLLSVSEVQKGKPKPTIVIVGGGTAAKRSIFKPIQDLWVTSVFGSKSRGVVVNEEISVPLLGEEVEAGVPAKE